jgi:AcrR family transcriptional regulator
VAREVGIVPTAFYRHFASIESLGLALVDESFVSLRAMLRDVRRGDQAFDDMVDRSITVLVEHVHQQRAHFLFIARERAAGPPGVRRAISHQIELVERELSADLARLPGTARWSGEDLRVLSNLIVTAMVATAEAILSAASHPDAEKAIVETARTQLRMVLVGALNWRSQP